MKLSNVLNTIKKFSNNHAPEILTGIGISGMLTGTVLAVRATPKAIQMINEVEEEKQEELTKIEIVKTCYKYYIPAALMIIPSTACIMGSLSVNNRRKAALATAYNISRNALIEYREKVVETLGEKKEQKIREDIRQDKLDTNTVTKNEVYLATNGETLCYDSISGRYFKSNIETINRAVNELNKQMLSCMYISLSEFYDMLGLDHTKNSDDVGWNINEEGFIEIDYSAHITVDGQPCVVVDYLVGPKYDYTRLI